MISQNKAYIEDKEIRTALDWIRIMKMAQKEFAIVIIPKYFVEWLIMRGYKVKKGMLPRHYKVTWVNAKKENK